MDSIRISDITMKQLARQGDGSLSFKGKIEVSKLLDKLAVPVIEIEGIRSARADALRIKSIAAAVKNSVVAVPVELSSESVEQTWEALKTARRPRLQVPAPVSTVQMEYLSRKKPDAMLKSIEETLRACAAKTADVEFIAEDATRSDAPFLQKAIETAVDAGATTVTVCDATGTLLPEELAAFLKNRDGVTAHMKKHAALIKPKFDAVIKALNDSFSDDGDFSWTEPKGGYFISLNVPEGCAKRTVELCKEAGVTLTGAGATYPYKNDPFDSNIRIAPTFPSLDELKLATEILCVCAEIAKLEKNN